MSIDAAMSTVTPGTPLHVLLVDDSVDATEMLALVLERKGCRIRTAHTGADAIASFERHRPDLVLLDLGLPDMDGRVVAECLRQRDAAPQIVALSGFAEDSPHAGGGKLFSRHLLKPVDMKALDEVLATARK